METFEHKLNEDLRSGLQRYGSMLATSFKRSRDNAKSRFWTLLGNDKEAGQLDLNHLLHDLTDTYHYYCGQMQYEQTAKSFCDFVAVMQGLPELDGNTLMSMMRQPAQPGNFNATNEGPIDQVFKAILDDQPDQDLETMFDQLDAWFKDKRNRPLMYEWMREIVQKRENIVNDSRYERLIPFIDRYLKDEELNRVLLTVARNIMRSRTLAAFAAARGEDGGATDNGTAKTPGTPSAKASPRTDFTKPIPESLQGSGTEESLGVILGRLDKMHFTKEIRDRFLDRRLPNKIAWGNEAENMLRGHCHDDPHVMAAVAANIFAYIVHMRIDVAQLERQMIAMARAANFIYPAEFIPALRLLILKGGDINLITEEFEHLLKRNVTNTAVFLEGMMRLAAFVTSKSLGLDTNEADS